MCHIKKFATDVRYTAALLLTAAAMFVAFAALPVQGRPGVLASVAPQTAQAYEGGWDRDHGWMKITAGEIAQGATYALCMRATSGRAAGGCRWLADRARQFVGRSHGVWAEVYWYGRVNVGTW